MPGQRKKTRGRDSDLNSNDIFMPFKRQDSELEWNNNFDRRACKRVKRDDSSNYVDNSENEKEMQLESNFLDNTNGFSLLNQKQESFYNSIFNKKPTADPINSFDPLKRFESNAFQDLVKEQPKTDDFKRMSMVSLKSPITKGKSAREIITKEEKDEVKPKKKKNSEIESKDLPPLDIAPVLIKNSSIAIVQPRQFDRRKSFDNNGEGKIDLKNLQSLLKKHFKGENLTDNDFSLSNVENDIFISLINRKYKIEIPKNETAYFIRNRLTQINSQNSKKRPEENYKFIFKRCLKYLRDKLKEHTTKKYKKKEFEKYFYEYYFKEIADKEGMSIEQFYHPRNSKSKFKKAPKTINNEYVDNISKSKDFVDRFLTYMNEELKPNYHMTIDIKINGLIKKWIEIFVIEKDRSSALKEIKNYIEKNKKCKLPWNDKEIQEAISAVNKLFRDYEPNN